MRKTQRHVRTRRLCFDRLEQRTLLVAGLTAIENQYWHQDLEMIDDIGESLDEFGKAVVSGDFNDDGFHDLAIGVPGESVGQVARAGAVNVIYGSVNRLTSLASQIWHQDSTDILSDLEAGDRFGTSLAAGDFNGDGADDLAIGVPRESVDGLADAGGVNVIYGKSSFGLTSLNNQFWTQRETVGDLEAGDRFGRAVAAGDFNGDGFDDLAVGAPLDSIAGVLAAGGVNVIYGSADGLTVDGNQFWSQDSADILDDVGRDDNFGSSLAAGDFNHDGFDELAIGVPGETINGQPTAGAVNVIYGSGDGLTAFANQFWNRNVDGILGSAQIGEGFGTALAAGDFNRDGRGDLAIGVPGERVNGVTNAGGVNVIYGSTLLGLTAVGNQLWHQDDLNFGLPITNSRFGLSLTAGDFDGSILSEDDDLAIGGNGANEAGVVNVIYGTNSGLDSLGAQIWQQGTLNDGVVVQGNKQPQEQFGAALGAGDFDNNGFSDLAVGVPADTVGTISDRIGAVNVLYGFDVVIAPTAADDAVSTGLAVEVVVDILANDSDPDGFILPTSVDLTPPTHGTATLDPVTGIVTYQPNVGFSGIDEMTYTVRDDSGLESAEATVKVTVAGWWNADNPLDVDGDGNVVPFDALAVINELNERTFTDESGQITLAEKSPSEDFLDVDGNNIIVPFDALLVINFLNTNPGPPASPAFSADDLDSADATDHHETDLAESLPQVLERPIERRLIEAAFGDDGPFGDWDLTKMTRKRFRGKSLILES